MFGIQISNVYANEGIFIMKNISTNMRGYKGGGVAELVMRPPTDPKVCGSNHRGPEYL
jgi:hypothetical protein